MSIPEESMVWVGVESIRFLRAKGRNIISATACREPTLNDCYVCSERIRIIHKGKSEYGNHQ